MKDKNHNNIQKIWNKKKKKKKNIPMILAVMKVINKEKMVQ